MKRNTYKIINEAKKNHNERYLIDVGNIRDIVDNAETMYEKKYSIILEILFDSFYFGYAMGKKEMLNKRRNKHSKKNVLTLEK